MPPVVRDSRAPSAPKARLTIAVDFHGVICAHPEGSRGATEPDWPAVPGAIDWLRAVSEHYLVHIVSARFGRAPLEAMAAGAAVRSWLMRHGIPGGWLAAPEGPARLTLSAAKPACVLWVDDRAWRFDGTFPTLEEIAAFRPWNR